MTRPDYTSLEQRLMTALHQEASLAMTTTDTQRELQRWHDDQNKHKNRFRIGVAAACAAAVAAIVLGIVYGFAGSDSTRREPIHQRVDEADVAVRQRQAARNSLRHACRKRLQTVWRPHPGPGPTPSGCWQFAPPLFLRLPRQKLIYQRHALRNPWAQGERSFRLPVLPHAGTLKPLRRLEFSYRLFSCNR